MKLGKNIYLDWSYANVFGFGLIQGASVKIASVKKTFNLSIALIKQNIT